MNQVVRNNFLQQTTTIASVPALAAAIRTLNVQPPLMASAFHAADPLVQMYQISPGAGEAEAAAYVVSGIGERLRRLGDAYGEWDAFDAPAYFDLSVTQTAQLLRVSERVSTVHITFFADLLLPAFQQTVAAWMHEFQPVYQRLTEEPVLAADFFQRIQPTLVSRWQHLNRVVTSARTILAADIGFLATNSAQEERERWRRWWQTAPAGRIDVALLPPLSTVPTLTLSFTLPLPAYRQPNRLRRLRRHRERQVAQRRRRKSELW